MIFGKKQKIKVSGSFIRSMFVMLNDLFERSKTTSNLGTTDFRDIIDRCKVAQEVAKVVKYY